MQFSKNRWDALFAEVEKNRDALVEMSSKIWENPELGHQEFMAADLLCCMLEKNGFAVERRIAGMETAFSGLFRSGQKGPKVAFVAEYDALPEIGHACAHNLFCCAAVGAGIALSAFLEKTGGQVVVLGSPAEEGVVPNYGGKVTLMEAGYFKDVACAFTAHGENETVIERSLAASTGMSVTFNGVAAHAGGSPEKGVNALTAGLLCVNNINAIRQHGLPGDVVNAIVTEGGTMPNTIPERCKMSFSIRAKTKANLQRILKNVKNSIDAAVLVTGCTYELDLSKNSYDDTLSNHELGLVMAEALDSLHVPYKQADARNYAWDAGNVSYVCPTLAPYFKIGPESLVGHTREFRDASNSSEGREAMIGAAKAMAATAFEYLSSEELQEKVKHEFEHTRR
ncbi:MAG: M20 family metallopeptidase [Synergistaceae bacterium]|jgi:amidohydrolase|nr:M20 family metallopeptidase [Synergistaceae bacterium]